MDDSTCRDGNDSGKLAQDIARAFFRSEPPGHFVFYKDHPFGGEGEEFHHKWTSTSLVTLRLGRPQTPPRLGITLREFKLTDEYPREATDLWGNPMFAYPRAIANQNEVLKSLINYTTESISCFLDSVRNRGSALDRLISERAGSHKVSRRRRAF